MEAQGQVRGGRFVSGFVGEQFALPEAVDTLRSLRRSQPSGEIIRISGADPLNLTGIITPGPRIRNHFRNLLYYRDGVPVDEEAYLISQAPAQPTFQDSAGN
jgi:ATP-dependent Lhr-like helicase